MPQQLLEGWESYPWICVDCQLRLHSADELRDHYANVHGEPTKYLCAECPKLYTKYSTFLTHARTHRTHLRYCCDICGKWFRMVCDQERHHAIHNDEKPHECVTCGKKFRLHSSLIIHTRSHLPADVKNKHQCDQVCQCSTAKYSFLTRFLNYIQGANE